MNTRLCAHMLVSSRTRAHTYVRASLHVSLHVCCREQNSYLIDRLAVGQELIACAASQDYSATGGKIRWHWGQELKSVDWDER